MAGEQNYDVNFETEPGIGFDGECIQMRKVPFFSAESDCRKAMLRFNNITVVE